MFILAVVVLYAGLASEAQPKGTQQECGKCIYNYCLIDLLTGLAELNHSAVFLDAYE